MIALFRANPEAFNGNINILRAGAILRVPSSDEVATISTAEAASEVSQQNAAWRAAGGGEDAGRLKLVTPPEGEAEAAAAPEASDASSRRSIRSKRTSRSRSACSSCGTRNSPTCRRSLRTPRAEEAEAAATRARARRRLSQPSGEVGGCTGRRHCNARRAAAGRGQAEARESRSLRPRPIPGPSFLDTLTDNWMILLGAAALLLLGMLGFNFYPPPPRRGRGRRAQGASTCRPSAPIPTETMRLRALATGDKTAEMIAAAGIRRPDDDDEDIVVEERPVARPKTEAPRPSAGHEETISAEAALDLDTADPLAEADFHMAYGLYDQAVDLVRMAPAKDRRSATTSS